MTLDEYLRAVGFAPLQATQIATAYAQAEDFSSWLQTQNLPSAVGGICEEWRKQYSKRTGWAAATIVEPLAARSFCIYRVVGPVETDSNDARISASSSPGGEWREFGAEGMEPFTPSKPPLPDTRRGDAGRRCGSPAISPARWTPPARMPRRSSR